VLDREPGRGGLQIYTLEGTWIDAPYDPAALTVNIGDLLARWTGDRWRSTRHRVLPPQAEAPDEDLLSLIFFYEANHDAVVESLPPPIGRTSFPPVIAHEYIGKKLDAIGLT
jgi:isopenicillin N synthase-like dioxygenase